MRYNLLISELERCWSARRAETASCSIQCHIKEQDISAVLIILLTH